MNLTDICRGFLKVKHTEVEEPEYKDVEAAECVAEQDGLFLIRTPEELAWVSKVVNEGTCNFDRKVVKLANDICLEGFRWVPIGKGISHSFRGVFDGNGKTVRNIVIDTDWSYSGFFGFVAGTDKIRKAEIRDLSLANVKICNGNENAWVGGLAGRAQEGVIVEKCSVRGSIRAENCAGGMIGYAEDCVTIRNCYAEVSFSVRGEAGGLVCCLTEHSVITDCRTRVEAVHCVPPEELVYDIRNNSIVRR